MRYESLKGAPFLMVLLLTAAGLPGTACGPQEEPPQAVVKGRALAPLDGAHLFVYREGMDLKGPAFASSPPSGADGGFSLSLPPGKYFFVLRRREGGATTGPLRIGDYRSEISGPVTIRPGDSRNLDFIAMKKAGEDKNLPTTAADPSSTGITGIIRDGDGAPVKGARVHAYMYPQMSERPKYVSEETGSDGSYVLFFPEGGTYYLAARNRFGGPPKLGELYGRYDDGTVEPSAVHVKDDEIQENVDISVHKIW